MMGQDQGVQQTEHPDRRIDHNLPSHGMVVDPFVVMELQIRIWRKFNAAAPVLDLKTNITLLVVISWREVDS